MDQTSRKTRIPELVRIKPLLGFEPYQYSLNLKLTAPHQLYFCDGWMDGWMEMMTRGRRRTMRLRLMLMLIMMMMMLPGLVSWPRVP